MIEANRKDSQQRMEKSFEALKNELSKLRTGRAHPSLIEQLRVNYYGAQTPLSQVAQITVEDARTLVVTPWDRAAVGDVDKALRSSDLGLNPVTLGQVIRIPLPALTEQRRKDLVKHLRHEGENAKVAIRNIRRDANNYLKGLLKDKSVTEDEERKAQDVIQKLTDRFIVDIEKLLDSKEKELMSIQSSL